MTHRPFLARSNLISTDRRCGLCILLPLPYHIPPPHNHRSSQTMPQRKEVTCWIEDAETEDAFEEYSTTYPDGSTATTFIKSEDGTPLTINVKFNPSIGTSWSPMLTIDGKRIYSLAWEQGEGDERYKYRIVGIRKSEHTFIPFVFAVNHITGIRSFIHLLKSRKRRGR